MRFVVDGVDMDGEFYRFDFEIVLFSGLMSFYIRKKLQIGRIYEMFIVCMSIFDIFLR